MLKIAVCDDDPVMVEQVKLLIKDTLFQSPLPYAVEGFLSGEALLKRLYEGKFFDIIYLDISMEGISGVEVGKEIREQIRDRRTLLIFMTSFEERAREVFECNTFRFLSKPVNREKFAEYLKSACLHLGIKEQKHLKFKAVRGEEMSVPFDDIVYLESTGRVIQLVTVSGRYHFYGKLREIAKNFREEDFIRIHNSILVNFDYISKMCYESVVLENGEIKDISGPKRKAVRERYFLIRRRRER